MNIEYTTLFTKAANDSIALGLLPPESKPIIDPSAVDEGRVLQYLPKFIPFLYSSGLGDSEALNSNCIEVHEKLQSFLGFWGIESHMTIGSMHGVDWDYCATDLPSLMAELDKQGEGDPIRLHTWLTLNDASIIDCTGLASLHVQMHENHLAERCLTYIPQGNQDITHYYIPRIIGTEFLIRTNSIVRIPKN